MDVLKACELVKGITFMPGWKFSAKDHTNRFERTILVHAEYDVYDTDVRFAPQYDQLITVYGDFPVIVEDCEDPDTFYFKFFWQVIMKIMMHECREFMSVDGENYDSKVFHPHVIEGMTGSWQRLMRKFLPDLCDMVGVGLQAETAFGKG